MVLTYVPIFPHLRKRDHLRHTHGRPELHFICTVRIICHSAPQIHKRVYLLQSLSTSTLTSTTLPASVIAFVLLHCLAHYASSHVFISTVLKLLYFFYSYVASKTMSSAYRRLLINFSPTLNSPANPYRAFHVTRSARMVNRQGDNLHPCRTPFLTQNHGDMVLAVLTAACCRYAGSNNSDDNEEERKTSVPYTADVTRTRFLVACRRRARGNLTTRFHMIG